MYTPSAVMIKFNINWPQFGYDAICVMIHGLVMIQYCDTVCKVIYCF